MFQRFATSWKLVKASAAVLNNDKELIVFPLISMIGSILVIVSFAVPMILSGFLDRVAHLLTRSTDGNSATGVYGLIVLFLFYAVTYTVVYFCNSALVASVMLRLQGKPTSLTIGFKVAWSHVGNIIGYALISATVGIILRSIAERNAIFGRIVASLIGGAWSIITFLVVPILVIEGVSPIAAIKRSGELLKKTWGEQIIGGATMGGIFGLISVGFLFLIAFPLMAVALATHSLAVIVGAGLVVVLVLIGLGLYSAALQGIFNAALYDYAVNGNAGTMFDPELLSEAFRQRRR